MKAKHHRTVVVFSGQVTEISQDGVQDVKENFFTQTFVANTNFIVPEADTKGNPPEISPRDGKKHKRHGHGTNDDDEISDSEFEALSTYTLPTQTLSIIPTNGTGDSLQGSSDSITNNAVTANNTNTNGSNGGQSPPVTPRRKLDASSRNSSSENLMANVSPNGGNSPPVAPRRKLDNSSRNNSNSGTETTNTSGVQSSPTSPRRKLSASSGVPNMNGNNGSPNVIIEKHEEVVTVLTLDALLKENEASVNNNGTASNSAQTTPRHVSQSSSHKNSPKAVMANFANSIQRAFSTKKKKRTDSVNKESNLAGSNGSDVGSAPNSPPERTHKPKNRSDNARKFLKGLFQLRSARAKNASKSQELTTGNTLVKSQETPFNTAPNSTEITSDSSSPTQSTSTSPRETQLPRYEPIVQPNVSVRDSRPLPIPRARSPTFLADNLANSGSSPKLDCDSFSTRQRASTDAHRSKRLPAPPVPPRRTKPKLSGTLSNVGSNEDVMSDAVDALPKISPGVLSDDNIFIPQGYRPIERRRVELHRSKSVATLNELLRGLDPDLLAEINGTANNTNENTNNNPNSTNNGSNSGPSSYLSPKAEIKRRSVSMRDVHLPLEESSE